MVLRYVLAGILIPVVVLLLIIPWSKWLRVRKFMEFIFVFVVGLPLLGGIGLLASGYRHQAFVMFVITAGAIWYYSYYIIVDGSADLRKTFASEKDEATPIKTQSA